jgi:CRP-like cAMP-binding protein
LITEHYNLLPDEVIESLRRVELLKGLPDDELRALVEVMKGFKAGPGDCLFDEGDEDDRFFIVTEGAVEIVKAVPGGGEEKLAVRRAGEVFGEMALLNDAPRSATARAAGECECLTLARGDFEKLMGGDSLALRLLKILSQALRALGIRFVNIERGKGGAVTAAGGEGRSVRLERSPPRVEGFDVGVGAAPNPSGIELSTWEALRFSDERVALLALSVQGDRVPPLYQLAVAQAFCAEFSLSGESPRTLLARVNDSLYRNQLHSGDQFVAAAMLVPQGDAVLWSNAGGMQGAILRKDGTVTELRDHGPPLGMMAGFQHEVDEIPIDSGDMVLVLSGGSRGLFRGAVHSLSDLQNTAPGEVVERVQQAIRGTQEAGPDEPTVLFLRRR